MTRKGIPVIAAIIILATTFAFAQAGPGGPGGPRPAPGGGPGAEAALVKFLALTDAQIASWTTFHDETRAAVKPLFEQRQALQTQLHTALSATAPDAATVGQLMISVRKVGDQLRTVHDGLDAKLKSVLTADQVAKFDAFRAARQATQGPGPGRGRGPGNGAGKGMGMGGGGMAYGYGPGTGGGACPNR